MIEAAIPISPKIAIAFQALLRKRRMSSREISVSSVVLFGKSGGIDR